MTGHRNTTPFVAFRTKEDRQPPLYVAPGEQLGIRLHPVQHRPVSN